jgi:hypothetical protein
MMRATEHFHDANFQNSACSAALLASPATTRAQQTSNARVADDRRAALWAVSATICGSAAGDLKGAWVEVARASRVEQESNWFCLSIRLLPTRSNAGRPGRAMRSFCPVTIAPPLWPTSRPLTCSSSTRFQCPPGRDPPLRRRRPQRGQEIAAGTAGVCRQARPRSTCRAPRTVGVHNHQPTLARGMFCDCFRWKCRGAPVRRRSETLRRTRERTAHTYPWLLFSVERGTGYLMLRDARDEPAQAGDPAAVLRFA